MKRYSPALLLDACVVSDILNVDVEIISLITQVLGAVYVPSVIVDELRRKFELDEIIKLGFEILEVSDEAQYAATVVKNQKKYRALTQNDCACLIMASQTNCSCVTNDFALQKACKDFNVAVLWELEVVLMLYERDGISYERAERYLDKLKRISFYITPQVSERFTTELNQIKKKKET